MEPVSRMFHDAPAVLRKELKALRMKAEQKPAATVWVAFVILYIVIWRGIQDSELLIFCFFLFFLTWSFCVER